MNDSNGGIAYQTHNFRVGASIGEFQVSIVENTRSVMTSCTCGGTQKCIHALQVLAAITANLKSGNPHQIQILQKRLNSTLEGRRTMARASHYFKFQIQCPACKSKNIKPILRATKLLLYLVGKGRIVRHRCKDCQRSW